MEDHFNVEPYALPRKKVQKSFVTLFADLPAGSGRDLSEFEDQQ